MVPESGELEVTLGDSVVMQCVTKGVPAPIISWRTKVIDIPGLFDIPLPMPTILHDIRDQSGATVENVQGRELGRGRDKKER